MFTSFIGEQQDIKKGDSHENQSDLHYNETIFSLFPQYGFY